MSPMPLINSLTLMFTHTTLINTQPFKSVAWGKSTSVHVLADVKTNLFFFFSILAFLCVSLSNKHLRSKQSHDCLWNLKAVVPGTKKSRVWMGCHKTDLLRVLLCGVCWQIPFAEEAPSKLSFFSHAADKKDWIWTRPPVEENERFSRKRGWQTQRARRVTSQIKMLFH